MDEIIKILLVEDEKIDQMAFSRFVEREGLPYDSYIVDSIQNAKLIISRQKFDVILTDYFLGADTALELLKDIHDIPCIVITGLGDEEIAVKAMKLGASDYLVKDSDGNYLKILPIVVSNAIKLKKAEAELLQYRENLEKMVRKRTEELSQLNQKLRMEIEERKQIETLIRLQATALESAVNGIMIMNSRGMLLWVNSSFEKMTGYGLSELEGRLPPFLPTPLEEVNESEELWLSIFAGKPWQGQMFITRKKGTKFIAEMTFTPVLNPQGEVSHFISICHDISDILQAKFDLEYIATHDTLTGLPNRLLFTDRLNHAIAMVKRENRQGAILFVDLDDFKSINDAYSHNEGDELLVTMGKRLKEGLRDSDTVARIGGDEFAILVENIDQLSLTMLAQKISQLISTPVEIRGSAIVTTASIGISVFPQDGDTFSVLLKNADLAMYVAKEKTKNTYQFYDSGMAAHAEKQMELATYLRYALMHNIFQLHFQPQVDVRTGKISGVEALLRLPHPDRVWIKPDEFIPIAEKTGMIIEIDAWVLKTVCANLKTWREEGAEPIKVSINLSNLQIGRPDIVDMMIELLRQYNVDPGQIELEISESNLFQNVEKTIKILRDLKSLGVKLALDDFGKGFSSLNYLAHFPLDTLKIDISFTKKIPSSSKDVAIINGIIRIADNLKLDIIVEGVENKEQLDFFRHEGCHFVQGFFFSPAVPENKLRSLMHRDFMLGVNTTSTLY